MTNRPALLTALFLGGACLTHGARAEDGPPKLDVEATCASAQRAQVSLSNNANKDACLNSERSAQTDLKKRWGEFPVAAKRQCSNQFEAGGYPSYVELLTCLELASGAVPTQPDSDNPSGSEAGGKADGERKSGSKLTREPSPAQRTDPIEVLQNK